MIREVYVAEDGSKVDYSKAYHKKIFHFLIFIVVIAISVIIYFIVKGSNESSFCKSLRTKIKKAAIEYAEKNEIMPTLEGDSTSFSLDDIVKDNILSKEDITIQNSVVKTTITITKYKKQNIISMDLEDAEYCTTADKKYGKETTKYNKNKEIVEVKAYYNYRTKETNYTKWSDELTEEEVEEKEDKKYGIRLPKNMKEIANIPSEAILEDIEVRNHVYYQYRDRKWKFYDIVGDYTNYFSSEQPEGYANVDKNTLKYTEWSDYSLSYPEKKDYRSIESKKAYKWYYMDGKKKVYYNNGSYAVKPDDEKYNEKDKDSTVMYRYRDRQYRWYNGQKRKYSSQYSVVPKGYNYRDDELYSYTSWSSLKPTTSLNDSNKSYREEREVYRYSYRKKYNIYSLYLLEKELPKEKFEEKVGKSLESLFEDDAYDVTVTYKFRYK